MVLFKKLFVTIALLGAFSAQAQLGLKVQGTEPNLTPRCGQSPNNVVRLRCGLQAQKPRFSIQVREAGEIVKVYRTRPAPEDLAPGQVVFTERNPEDGTTVYVVVSKP
jgi:hypothetical protein